MASTAGAVADPPRQLVIEWALCGIANAAARFIPVPFVDDAVRDRAWQFAVHRTLAAHDRTYDDAAVEPLTSREGDMAGVVRALRAIPRKLLLFPIRKYAMIFGAVRGVPNDVMRVVLIGRTVHRALERGRLANGSDEAALRAEAEALREAYEAAIKNQDFRMLRGAVADGLSQRRRLTRVAVAYARDAFARDEQSRTKPGGEVEETAEKVEELLQRPDVVEQIEEFDRRVDERLAKAGSRR
jgi:hypothetical protein